jgi:hypothetical protein
MADEKRKATSADLKYAGVSKSGLARKAGAAIEDRNVRMQKAMKEALGEDQEDHACYSGDCANRKKEKE